MGLPAQLGAAGGALLPAGSSCRGPAAAKRHGVG